MRWTVRVSFERRASENDRVNAPPTFNEYGSTADENDPVPL